MSAAKHDRMASVVGKKPDVHWQVVEEEYRGLLDAARRPARTESVNAVWAAIAHLKLSKVPITVAAVARACELSPSKMPKAQSIRNDPKGLQRLIELAAATQTNLRTGAKPTKGGLADRISDPQQAAEVRILEAERDAFERKYESLKACFHKIEPLGVITRQLLTEKVENLQDLRDRIEARPIQGVLFDSDDRAVVGHLVKFLEDDGLSFDPVSGDLCGANGLSLVRGDLHSVLLRVMTAASPKGDAAVMPEAFKNTRSRAA